MARLCHFPGSASTRLLARGLSGHKFQSKITDGVRVLGSSGSYCYAAEKAHILWLLVGMDAADCQRAQRPARRREDVKIEAVVIFLLQIIQVHDPALRHRLSLKR